MGWVDSLGPTQASKTGTGGKAPSERSTKARARTAPRPSTKVTTADVQRVAKSPPQSLRPAVTRATAAAIDARIDAWRSARNTTAIGNLGEQVAMRALERLGYEVMATQADLKGAVPAIVGKVTRMNPEDLIAVTQDDRFTTVNVKATASETTSRVTAGGDLSTPAMSKGQNLEQYYSTRAELLSPLDDDGKAFGQVMKVDLVNKLAQVFEIDPDGHLSPVDKPVDVLADIVAVCLQFPGTVDAPVGPNAMSQSTWESS